jgi:hypothetical protein
MVIVDASGTLTAEDYEGFAQSLQSALLPENRRMLVRMTDFEGWTPAGLWEDLKLDTRFHDAFERIAIVGDKHWERWMTELAKPFMQASVKYFDEAEAAGAVAWLLEADGGSARG